MSSPAVYSLLSYSLRRSNYVVLQLWQVRLPLLKTRVLFRCASSTGENAGGAVRLPGWLQWVIRIQVRGEIPRRAQLHLDASLQCVLRSCLYSPRLLHRARAQLQKSDCLVGDIDGSLREFIRDNLKIHLVRLDASLLHTDDDALLGTISSVAERKLFTRMVFLALSYWSQYWLCLQRKVGWLVLHSPCRPLHC